MNPENNQRLLAEAYAELQSLNAYHQIEIQAADNNSIKGHIDFALLEHARINPGIIEEMSDVKSLHDRIHQIVIALRVARNNLERMEHSADIALEKIRQLARSVEEPEDHEL